MKLKENQIENWKLFKQRWDAYKVLSNYDELQLNIQKALLIQCLGDEALQVYNSFTVNEETTIKDIFTLFDNYIIGSTNDTYERYKFNKRMQTELETFDCFLADLQRQIKSCNYCKDCEPSLLKDRIVLGIKDCQTQKDLLKVRDLTLQKTIDICKASEKATFQNKDMHNEAIINKVKHTRITDVKSVHMKTCKF